MDPEAYRAGAAEMWERSAQGWGRRRAAFDRAMVPVTGAMLDAARLQPGRRVLELAAGPGETGLLAAELVRPGGSVIVSDASEAMLEVARARAAEREAGDVEFRRIDAEWIDLPTATVDVVLCRFGLMLVADPETALREVRRVLRPGGRLALAAWADPAANPWTELANEVALELGLTEPRDPDAPGMFAFARAGRIEDLLAGAGFLDGVVETVGLELRYDDLDGWWEERVDLSAPFNDLLTGLGPADRDRFRAAIDARLAAFAAPDGRLAIPASVLVAAADA
jgi:SAM-dependent methyltransferase